MASYVLPAYHSCCTSLNGNIWSISPLLLYQVRELQEPVPRLVLGNLVATFVPATDSLISTRLITLVLQS